MYMKKLILPLSLALAAMTPAMATPVVDYDFTDGSWTQNSVQAVKDAGFTLNASADHDISTFIGGGASALVLRNSNDYRYPTATYAFGEGIAQGNATITANSSGASPFVGKILFLDADDNTLFGLQLRDSSTLNLYVEGAEGSSGPNVLPGGLDITNFLEYSFEWSSNTDGTGGTISMAVNGIALGEQAGVPFPYNYVEDGVVASLRYEVGYANAGTDRYLRVTTMEVNSIPEPGTTPALFGLGLLGLICAKRRLAK